MNLSFLLLRWELRSMENIFWLFTSSDCINTTMYIVDQSIAMWKMTSMVVAILLLHGLSTVSESILSAVLRRARWRPAVVYLRHSFATEEEKKRNERKKEKSEERLWNCKLQRRAWRSSHFLDSSFSFPPTLRLFFWLSSNCQVWFTFHSLLDSICRVFFCWNISL